MQKAEPSIRDSIMAAYAGLPPGEQKLADTVLARLSNLASYSATELAGEATVSKATAARFFRRIGYPSFAHARQRARADAQQASPLSGFDGATPKARGSDALSRHLATEVRNLSESFRQVDQRMLGAAVRLLAKAPRVHVVGLRNGHFVAAHVASLLAQVRESVAAIPHAAMTLAEDLAGLRRGDVLLVVDFRRRSVLLPSIVAAARQAGARLVFLASPTQPPLARAGDAVLHCLTETSSIFDSYAAAISMVNYLAAAVAGELGKSSRRRLEAIETLHESLGDVRA